jgi:hypothetical protein
MTRPIPFGSLAAASLLRHEPVFDVTLWLMSRVDRRPGRLVSIVCRKPEAPSRD